MWRITIVGTPFLIFYIIVTDRKEINMKKCIVLIGPPCSGKSSVGKLLASNIRFKYVSSGDIARKMAEEDGTIENLNAGRMAPEDRMRTEIEDILRTDDDIILDGFPRFMDQYKWLIERFFGREFLFILVDVPTLSLFCRAADRHRADDGAFIERLEYYKNNTVPMIRKIGGIIEVSNITLSSTVREIERYLHDCRWI